MSAAEGVWETIVSDAVRESPLWADALRPEDERELEPVFSVLGDRPYALAVETIYEGYLLHYGRARLFDPREDELALLLGDYLYAQGLVRVAEAEAASPEDRVGAVSDLAELISLCAQARAERRGEDDGPAWAATAALLGSRALEPAREALRHEADSGLLLRLATEAAGADAVASALTAHARRVSRQVTHAA